MQKKITIAGCGMGSLSDMTVSSRRLLEEAELVIGAARLTEGIRVLYQEEKAPEICAEYLPNKITERIKSTDKQQIVILMSGDSGFYSGTKKLLKALEKEGFTAQIEPGVSSLSYFASRLKLSWEDAKIISLHGSSANLTAALKKHEKVFVLTQGQTAQICKELTETGFGSVKLYVGRNLSYPEEEIIETTPEEYSEDRTETLSVLLLIRDKARREMISGIADEAFVRGKVPMTKSEVRAVILSKLAVQETDIVYDIGAGTGSVSVELAAAAQRGRVYAIEYKEEALALIEENKKRFGCANLEVVKGMAPEAMEALPPADAVFIGGTKGNLFPVLEKTINTRQPVRIVVSAVTVETLSEVFEDFERLGIALIDACQIAVTRLEKVGHYHMMKAQNPVFLITGQYGGQNEPETVYTRGN